MVNEQRVRILVTDAFYNLIGILFEGAEKYVHFYGLSYNATEFILAGVVIK